MASRAFLDSRRVQFAALIAASLGSVAVIASMWPVAHAPLASRSEAQSSEVRREPLRAVASIEAGPRIESGSCRTLHGIVRARDGRRIPDVSIAWDGDDNADRGIRTGIDGSFVLEGIASGSHQLIARSPAILTWSGFVDIGPGSGDFTREIVVDLGVPVSGFVVDDHGLRVADARLTPWRRGPSAEELDARTATSTDDAGRFELRGAATGPTWVLVEHAGHPAKKVALDPRRVARVQLEHISSVDRLRPPRTADHQALVSPHPPTNEVNR